MMENSIRFYRLRKGITQIDLAKAIGVSQQAVAKWETSKTSVSLEYVPLLSKALEVRKELLFPGLAASPRPERTREEVEEQLEYVLPYEVIIHFRNRKEAYWAEINRQNERRIHDLLYTSDMESIWFETLDNMIVAVNRKQIRSVELGRDLASLPENVIERQELGAIDPDFESEGDDRYVRIFLQGWDHAIEDYPELGRDGGTALSILADALGDLIFVDEFQYFDTEFFEDPRRIYFRPEDYELVEGPKCKFEAYMARLNEELSEAPKPKKKNERNQPVVN